MTSQIPRDPGHSSSSDDLLWEAIARVHAGESPPEEAERIHAHLAANAGDAQLLELLAQREGRDADIPHVDVEAALVAVRRRLIEVDATRTPSLTVIDGGGEACPPRTWRTAAAAAAAVAVVAFGALQVRSYLTTAAATAPALQLTTQSTQLDSLRLPDGTLVVLGPLGEITVAEGYGSGHRTVRLSGWGYFVVNNDDTSAPPFIVQTDAAHIQDIGTAFVVRTDSARGARVTVTDGIVRVTPQVGDNTSPVDVSEGERLEVSAARVPRLTRSVDVAGDAAWTRGQLVFRDTPLADVAHALSQWYGVRVEVDSALRGSLVGELATDSLPKALQVLTLTFGATVQQSDGVVRLVPGDRAPAR